MVRYLLPWIFRPYEDFRLGLRLDVMGLTDWRSYGVTHADVRGFHFPPGYFGYLVSDDNLVENYFPNRDNIRRGGYTGFS